MSEFQSPHWLSDDEIKKKGILPHQIQQYRNYYYMQSFGLDRWYDELKAHTFETKFLYLNKEEITALIFSHRKVQSYDKLYGSSKLLSPKKTLEQTEQILSTLEKKIDERLQDWGDLGCFIKINTRSPKDVAINSTGTKISDGILENVTKSLPNVIRERRRYGEDKTGIANSNDIIDTFTRVTTALGRITTGQQAIELLAKSDRVYTDLSSIYSYGNDQVLENVCIVLRKWFPTVPDRPYGEFRGFVYKNQLNALSQYDNCTFFPQIVDKKEQIENLIRKFFEKKIKNKLKHIESYVIDFYYDSDDRIYIIELNPFHIAAGPSLFSWKSHRELFMNGPFEFRIVEKNVENSLVYLNCFWERQLKLILRDYNLQMKRTNLVTMFAVSLFCFLSL